MRARKQGKGGRHVAIECGLKSTGSGWPFRRELRELASQCFGVRRWPSPHETQIMKGEKPCEA